MFNATSEKKTAHVCYGDVIGVHRYNGLYDHYGVYESQNCVYEFAAINGDFGDAIIHTTTLDCFIGRSKSFFTLSFPKEYGTPEKRAVSEVRTLNFLPPLNEPAFEKVSKAIKQTCYHLYSPEETVSRAKSRLGERGYNLLWNNCEHYAIWCKTGLHESHQVQALLKELCEILLAGVLHAGRDAV